MQGRADPEIHLIPADFVGEVTIVFRAANGEPIATEDDARLYKVPANGILLTQAMPNVGINPAWKFFRVAANGQRDPITHIWASTVADTAENRANPEVGIFYPHRGRLQAGQLPCDVEFDQYFVGTRSQLLTRNSAADRRRLSEYLQSSFLCK